MIKIFRVSGSSMQPTLSDGDYVVAVTRWWRPREGRLAVVNHKDYGIIVKRVLLRSSGGYRLTSDHAHGTDSRTIGEVPEGRMIGPVLFAVRRPGGRSKNASS